MTAQFITRAQVVLTVVYSKAEPDEEPVAYKEDLEGASALVKLVPRAQGVKCVLEAQVIRTLNYPEVLIFSVQKIMLMFQFRFPTMQLW